MADKIVKLENDHINKNDLEIILQVNRKAVEIESNVAEQNETIIVELKEVQTKLDKIDQQNIDLSKDIFKLQILLMSGIIGLIIQLIYILRK